MDIHHTRRLQIELRDDEIEALKVIVRLAYDHLRNSPRIQMRGNPCQKQAGIVGPQLFHVKTMLEQFGRSIGVDCPYDAEPDTSYPIATI